MVTILNGPCLNSPVHARPCVDVFLQLTNSSSPVSPLSLSPADMYCLVVRIGRPMMRMHTWAALAAGLIAAGISVAQPPKTGPVKPVSGTVKDQSVEVKKPADALAEMLAEARTAHAKTRDYTGTFTRQERINGALSAEQVAEMKLRVSPAGVHVRFVRPEAVAGMEVAFSGAKKDGRMRYRPAGIEGFERGSRNSRSMTRSSWPRIATRLRTGVSGRSSSVLPPRPHARKRSTIPSRCSPGIISSPAAM
jgi:hypothetical protein